MLIKWLPPGSALHRAMYPEAADWSVTDYLLANVIDELAAANWQRANAGLEKGKAPSPRPKPMYRPNVEQPAEPEKPKKMTWDEKVAWYKRNFCDRREVTDGS